MYIKIILGFIVVLCLISINSASSAAEDEDNDAMDTELNLRELDDIINNKFSLPEILGLMIDKRACRKQGKFCSRRGSDNCCPGMIRSLAVC